MNELLTTKQLQDLLKVDRITVYRMLDDGRLKGLKIGNQWRFQRAEIDRLLGEEENQENIPTESISDFPSTCVEEVQNIFAGIIGIGAITVTTQGKALTEPIFSNPFCELMLSSATGRQACQNSWRKIALKSTGEPNFQICHAGLCYKRALISMDDQSVAWLIAGQYYLNSPDREKEKELIEELALKHDLPFSKLRDAALHIPILNRNQQQQVIEWTPKVAKTIQSILCERSDLMSRLQRISEISTVQSTLSK